jgi:hypothetical protein
MSQANTLRMKIEGIWEDKRELACHKLRVKSGREGKIER